MKFTGKLSHSTRSGSLNNIYYTKKLGVHCCLIDQLKIIPCNERRKVTLQRT